jgi:hypothetical protein
MDGMGNSAGLASLSECLWEVEAIEQILTQLRCVYDTAKFSCDIRFKSCAAIQACAAIEAT